MKPVMDRARPTIRCLRDDLHLQLPSAQTPLDQLDGTSVGTLQHLVNLAIPRLSAGGAGSRAWARETNTRANNASNLSR